MTFNDIARLIGNVAKCKITLSLARKAITDLYLADEHHKKECVVAHLVDAISVVRTKDKFFQLAYKLREVLEQEHVHNQALAVDAGMGKTVKVAEPPAFAALQEDRELVRKALNVNTPEHMNWIEKAGNISTMADNVRNGRPVDLVTAQTLGYLIHGLEHKHVTCTQARTVCAYGYQKDLHHGFSRVGMSHGKRNLVTALVSLLDDFKARDEKLRTATTRRDRLAREMWDCASETVQEDLSSSDIRNLLIHNGDNAQLVQVCVNRLQKGYAIDIPLTAYILVGCNIRKLKDVEASEDGEHVDLTFFENGGTDSIRVHMMGMVGYFEPEEARPAPTRGSVSNEIAVLRRDLEEFSIDQNDTDRVHEFCKQYAAHGWMFKVFMEYICGEKPALKEYEAEAVVSVASFGHDIHIEETTDCKDSIWYRVQIDGEIQRNRYTKIKHALEFVTRYILAPFEGYKLITADTLKAGDIVWTMDGDRKVKSIGDRDNFRSIWLERKGEKGYRFDAYYHTEMKVKHEH